MIEYRVLGPVEVVRDGEPIMLQTQQRSLLAHLLVRAGQVVPADVLVESLWDGRQPANTANALQAAVSRLRRQLANGTGSSAIVTRPPGYLIAPGPDELDLGRFRRLVGDAQAALRDGDAPAASGALHAALCLWRGPALADLTTDELSRESARLDEERLAATELLLEARLLLGESSELVAELEALVVQHPYREGFRAQLMLALYRSSRQAEALQAYQQARSLLVDELGIEPSRALQELERAILRQDPTLELPASGAALIARGRLARQVDAGAAAAATARDEVASIESEVADSVVALREAQLRSTPRSDGPPVCPFKGLAAFGRDDAAFFFGRERLLGDVVARLAGARVVCLTGASGSGKSSLLAAGLLPALADGVLPGSERRRQVLIRPDLDAEARLDEAGAEGMPLIVAVDQLEELFTRAADDPLRDRLTARLVELADDGHLVVVTVRADYYGHLSDHPRLATALTAGTVLVGPPTEEELDRAIRAPAALAGLSIEPGLAEALVAEAAGEPGALPLLQTALLELWSLRDERTLTLRAHEATGGLRGAIGRLAESTYERLDADHQEIARRLLVRLADDGEAGVVRRRVPLSELETCTDTSGESVLEALVQGRLVSIDGDVAEVAHEALFREWPRLRGWLEDDASGRAVRRALTDGATAWAAAGRDDGDLLRGARLASTLAWCADHRGEPTTLETAYLDASVAAADAELARQRRANRRLRAALAGAALLLAAAVVAGVVALGERNEANDATTEATAQRLGAQALVEQDLDRSLLLARQGVALIETPATVGNLISALQRSPAATRVLRDDGDRIIEIALRPDGRRLVITDNQSSLIMVDTATGARVGETVYFPELVDGGLGFSGDGRLLAAGHFASAGGSAGLQLLDGDTLKLVHDLTPDLTGQDEVSAVAFSEDGTRLAAFVMAGPPELGVGSVVVWDTRTGRKTAGPRRVLDGGPGGIRFAADGALVASGRHAFAVLDPDSLDIVRTTQYPVAALGEHGAFVSRVSPTGATVVAGSQDGEVLFADVRTGAFRTGAGRHDAAVQEVTFTRDGKTAVTMGDDRRVLVWDVAAASPRETLEGHAGRVHGGAVTADGATLYTAGLDASVIAWDLGGDRRFGRPLVGPPMPYPAPSAVTPDGTALAIVSVAGGADLMSLRSGKRTRLIRLPVDIWAMDGAAGGLLAVGGDDSTLALVGRDGTVRRLEGVPDAVGAVRFDPAGARLAAGTRSGTAVFDVPSGRRLLLLPADVAVNDVAWSADGSSLAAAAGGMVTVFDAKMGRRSGRVEVSQEDIFSTRFSPDGTLLAVGNVAGEVTLWDTRTWAQSGSTITGHNGFVLTVGFSPDGRVLATSSTDGTVRLFDVATRRQIGSGLRGVANHWVTMSFLPDGNRIVGWYPEAGRGFVWDLDPTLLKNRACAVAGRSLTQPEWEAFLPGVDYAPACR